MRTKSKHVISAFAVLLSLCTSFWARQDLSLTTTDNAGLSLNSLRGRVVVLLFAGTADPQCRDEFKALAALADRYRGKSVNIYWVSLDPPAVSNEKLKNPCGPAGSITVLRDQSRNAFKRFSGRTQEMPTVVVLDQQGQPQGQPRGGFNPDSDFVNDMAAIIDRLLSQK